MFGDTAPKTVHNVSQGSGLSLVLMGTQWVSAAESPSCRKPVNEGVWAGEWIVVFMQGGRHDAAHA
jgi:hypothetical protein